MILSVCVGSLPKHPKRQSLILLALKLQRLPSHEEHLSVLGGDKFLVL